MTPEQEELYHKMAEALTLRKIAQLESDDANQQLQLKRDELQLRIVEVEFLLAQQCAISLIIYRDGDEVGVIDCVNQDLCREVLERILKEDKEKLKAL